MLDKNKIQPFQVVGRHPFCLSENEMEHGNYVSIIVDIIRLLKRRFIVCAVLATA